MPVTPAPPPPLVGLIARDIPGVSASPNRVWAATLAVFRAAGLHPPPGARWEYLPWDTPVGENGETIDGVAYPGRNLVRVHPFKAAGDGRDLAEIMAHEVAHLVSFAVEARVRDDRAEEAAAEAIARDLVPVIHHRLRVNYPIERGGAYQAQVNPFVRGTFRACRASMPRATVRRVEHCARHTRRAFLLMDQANRANALIAWGVSLPRIPGRPGVHDWIQANP